MDEQKKEELKEMIKVKEEPEPPGLAKKGSKGKRDQEFNQLMAKFQSSLHLIWDPVKFRACVGKDGKPRVSQVRMRDQKKRTLHFFRLCDAFGVCHEGLMNLLLSQVAHTFHGTINSEGKNCEILAAAMNATIALLGSIKPQDSVETMLAVQMVGVHNLAMETLKRAMITDQTFEGKVLITPLFIEELDGLKQPGRAIKRGQVTKRLTGIEGF